MKRLPVVLVSVMTLQPLSCADGPSGPSALPGDYSLTRVDGAAVPAMICSTATDVSEITSGELSLGLDRDYQFSIDFRSTSSQTVEQTVVRWSLTDQGSFTTQPGYVSLESAFFDTTWQGTVTASEVTLEMDLPSPCGPPSGTSSWFFTGDAP